MSLHLTKRTRAEQERNLHACVCLRRTWDCSPHPPGLQRAAKTRSLLLLTDQRRRQGASWKLWHLKYKYHHALRRIEWTPLLQQLFWPFPISFILELRVMLSTQPNAVVVGNRNQTKPWWCLGTLSLKWNGHVCLAGLDTGLNKILE